VFEFSIAARLADLVVSLPPYQFARDTLDQIAKSRAAISAMTAAQERISVRDQRRGRGLFQAC